jgi:4-hydroxybenzoate polyprenyltransferase
MRAHLQLMRPANLLTAEADILAGYAAAGWNNPAGLGWLLVSAVGLYGGGVVFNDVFDRKLDAVERPERPIPSGRASPRSAALLGSALLAMGIAAAFSASIASGVLALLIAGAALLYDAWAKSVPALGPLVMGSCRGLNLLLGVSAAPGLLGARWYLALLPLVYIAAVTAVSGGEVHGGRRATAMLSLALYGAVGLGLLALSSTPDFHLLWMAPFAVLLAYRVGPPLWRAYLAPEPGRIRDAVRAGVLSLIVLDATLAAGYAGPLYGLGILLLLPAAGWLARFFAVT